MTPAGDNDAPTGGALAGGSLAKAPTAANRAKPPAAGGCLLVAVEPGEGPVATAARALLTEGARLAGGLEVDLRAVTWTAEAEPNAEAIADHLAGLACSLVPHAVLLADTDLGRRVAPLTAHHLSSGAVLGCSDVRLGPGSRSLTFVKPAYGGWLEQEVEPASGFIPVATLVLDGLEPPDDSVATLAVPEVLEVAKSAPSRVRHLETVAPDARSVDLVHAKRIVAAGSGSASEKLLAAVQELADLLDGSVGATRPVVDEGRLPKERLIGQTGRTVNPELYLALGISGSPHHVAGVRSADRILSINRDTRAPIFQFSDVGYVADLEEVLPALVQRIKEWRDEPGRPT